MESYIIFKGVIYEQYKIAFDEEVEWINYIFSKGSVIGLNANILIDYLKYIINRRLKAVGLKIMFSGYARNPLPWIESYINMDKNEILPQEGEIISYISGKIDNNKEELDLTEFSFD